MAAIPTGNPMALDSNDKTVQRPASRVWHVCGLVVQTKAKHHDRVVRLLGQLPGCEVTLSEPASGKLVIIVEGPDSDALLNTIESARHIPAVLAVSLVYHQQDDQGEEHHEIKPS